MDEGELAADMQQVADHAQDIDGDDEDGDGGREPGAGVFAAVLPRQQQFQGQREGQHLARRIDEHPDRHAFVADDEEG